ncbi:cellulase M [Bellilinea caldifistulae]|nr:M42 family peptidase [Bellilinea caldifistulae]GAP12032.1 cellulase M [Bellilinea caldifistulae]
MMSEIKDFLKDLISLPGLSGYESPVGERIQQEWQPLVDEISFSPLGSLHALKRGSGEEPRPSILLAAHMDAIGMMVTEIVDGWLRFTPIGGIDPRILPGQQVIVHGREDLPAVVVQPPAHLLPDEVSPRQSVDLKYLLVDTGLLPEQVRELVRVGDLISFAQPPLELSNDLLAGHSLDNRASIAALTVCLRALQPVHHVWDVWAVATVQEEITLGGGYTSPFSIRPDLAVAVDVTFAKGPGGPSDYRTFPLGKGLTIGWGANIHPAFYRALKETAERLDIPFHNEILPARSGTDAYAMQIIGEGISTAVLSIPLRYMHTPVEIISMKDVQRTGHLLAQFIASLPANFMEQMKWDE